MAAAELPTMQPVRARTRRPRPEWPEIPAVAALTIAAILLRLIAFAGRGDYVAFDEGWYLLLGQSLFHGDGYSLTGMRHVSLSPLFPVLAGLLDLVLQHPVRAGRIIAALTGGLLVVPCWSIFRRLAGRRTALLAAALVAAMPSLAAFVAPQFVGWELWVGAEPVMHLFLFTGIAFFLRALDRGAAVDWALAGAGLALAYLARPEAIIPAGMLALLAGAFLLVRRTVRATLGVAVMGLAFVLLAAPYWVYLHDVLGRWTITGRDVSLAVATLENAGSGGPAAGGGGSTVARMLWQGDQRSYARQLYSLDATGRRMGDWYWGFPRDNGGSAPDTAPAQPPAANQPAVQEQPGPETAPWPALSNWRVYGRTLDLMIPWFVVPFALIGLFAARRRRLRDELIVAVPLAVTSVVIVVVVAVDPRTQLFLVPLLAFYAARGLRITGMVLDRRHTRTHVRRGLLTVVLAGSVFFGLLSVHARRIYFGASIGSRHQVVATAMRNAAAGIRELVPEDAAVMSWHPAAALYARRDWRALPLARLDRVIRYAGAQHIDYIALSRFYPSPVNIEQERWPYLILHVDPAAIGAGAWRIEVTHAGEHYALGRLVPM